MAARRSSRTRARCFHSSARSSATPPIEARGSPRRSPPSPTGRSRSSHVPTSQVSRCCPSDGSSSAPSLGSGAAAGSPRTSKTSLEPPSLSSGWPASASCFVGSQEPIHESQLSERTLRKIRNEFAHRHTAVDFSDNVVRGLLSSMDPVENPVLGEINSMPKEYFQENKIPTPPTRLTDRQVYLIRSVATLSKTITDMVSAPAAIRHG